MDSAFPPGLDLLEDSHRKMPLEIDRSLRACIYLLYVQLTMFNCQGTYVRACVHASMCE